jgi:hypothetical protein
VGYFTELFAVDSKQALTFFFERLKDGVNLGATQAEALYVAGILAHYAQTSRSDTTCMPPASNLHEVLDNFVLPGLTADGYSGLQDPEILEAAGSQTLLLVGFFRDQMRRRYNLEWYDEIGSGFFARASDRLQHGKKANLLRQVAQHFPMWAVSCNNMSRTLREERYLLKLD